MLERLIERELAGWLAAVISASPAEEERIMARVAIVTGGTRGIGEAISIALQGHGHEGRGELRRQ